MNPAGVRPLVSIVIPCHNQGRDLGAAVNSATARTGRVQVIVIDDGSTDDTAAIARSFDQVLLIRQARRGQSEARNRGLRAATGEFVIFLDPRDRLMPGAIDAGLRALAAHPACAMSYGRAVTMGPEGEIRAGSEMPTVRAGHHAALLQTNLIANPAMVMFRREAVERAGGFAAGLDGAADYDLYLRLSRDAPIHDHGQTVAACRRDERSSGQDAARLLRDTLAVMRRHCPDEHAELRRAWREGYARWQDFYGSQLMEEIRAHLHAGELRQAGRKAVTLATHAPWVMAREMSRAGRVIPAAPEMAAAELPGSGRRAR